MYRRIIVPIDGSHAAEQVVPHVRALATSFGASVVVLSVTPPVPTVAGVPVASKERWNADHDAEANPSIERVEAQMRANGVDAAVERIHGAPAQVIVQRAHELGSDLITMTTHGR